MICKALLVAVLLLFSLPGSRAFASAHLIYGSWQYDGFHFEDHRYPKPNPRLHLQFTFTTDGRHSLTWFREGESTFCQSEGPFELTEKSGQPNTLLNLFLKIDKLHPDNSPDCANDPDMKLGQTTTTPISFVGHELRFHLDLNGKPFLYILVKTN